MIYRSVVEQTSANPDQQKRRLSDPKASVFVPPFRKNLKVPKNSVPTAVAPLPNMSVPPIKKKDTSESVHGKDLPYIESTAITSSDCEKGSIYSARKLEDQEAATKTTKEKQVENCTTVTCETKGRQVESLSPFFFIFNLLLMLYFYVVP